jgi:hypothetical protein
MSKLSNLVKPKAPLKHQDSNLINRAPIVMGIGITMPLEIRYSSTKIYSAHPQAIRNAEFQIGAKNKKIMTQNLNQGTCRSEEGTANYKNEIKLINTFVQLISTFSNAKF